MLEDLGRQSLFGSDFIPILFHFFFTKANVKRNEMLTEREKEMEGEEEEKEERGKGKERKEEDKMEM